MLWQPLLFCSPILTRIENDQLESIILRNFVIGNWVKLATNRPITSYELPITNYPFMMRQRQDPYEDKPGKTSTTIWIARLIVLFIVVTMLVTAVIVLIDTYRSISGLDSGTFNGGSPNLNPVERLFLENYFSSRTEALAQPIGQGTETAVFTIEPGQRADQVADNLAAAGLLFDTELFINYVRYQGLDAQLAAGSFRLNPQQTIPELAVALTQTQILEVEVNFLTGWRLEEMANYLDTIKPAEIEAQAFLALVQRDQPLILEPIHFLSRFATRGYSRGLSFPWNLPHFYRCRCRRPGWFNVRTL